MRLKFKPEVELQNLNLEPHIIQALAYALHLAPPTRGSALVVTSASDGSHSPNSRHYIGFAWDIRLRDEHDREGEPLSFDLIEPWISRLQQALPDWDIIDEGDHLHMEYDPK